MTGRLADRLQYGSQIARTHLCGRSYGALLAAADAWHAPTRVDHRPSDLAAGALVDPTQVAGFRLGRLVHTRYPP